MKKLLTILLTLCLLLTMAGCGVSRLEQRMDAAEERMEQRMDALEHAVEEAVRQNAAPAMATEAPAAMPRETAVATEEAPQMPPETTPAPSAAEQITREQAQQIALDHVGLTADQVERLRANLEMDDGIAQYDVEFLAGDWEYEFEIGAGDGKLLSYDKDSRWD